MTTTGTDFGTTRFIGESFGTGGTGSGGAGGTGSGKGTGGTGSGGTGGTGSGGTGGTGSGGTGTGGTGQGDSRVTSGRRSDGPVGGGFTEGASYRNSDLGRTRSLGLSTDNMSSMSVGFWQVVSVFRASSMLEFDGRGLA